MHNYKTETSKIIMHISGVDTRKCMKCGKCSATCPAYSKMDVLPHRFVSMVEEGNIAPLLQSQSIWKCLSCFACVERCPRGVEPAKLIEAIRLMYIRKQGQNYLSQDEIPDMADEKIPQQALVSAFRKYSK